MTLFEAVEIVEQGDEDEDKVIAAWQWLHETGMAYELQGWYGRVAQHLVQQGLIQ